MRGFLARVLLVVGCILFAGMVSAQEPELLPARAIEFVSFPAFPEAATLSLSPSQQTMSEQGIEVLKVFESFRPRAYRDGGGGFSIGYGFQTWKGRRVSLRYPGRVTVAQAEAELRRQLTMYEDIVRTATSKPLLQHQFDALVSLAYNTGNLGGKRFINRINGKDELCERDFTNTVFAISRRLTNRDVLRVLTDRRKLEYQLYAGVLELDGEAIWASYSR
jgi:GH24 family phage-related lysozyme (muramidase)